MPESLGKRRAQREAKDLQWQWVFPAKVLTLVPKEGHSDIKTTMIYTHTVQSRTKKEMVSPLDLFD